MRAIVCGSIRVCRAGGVNSRFTYRRGRTTYRIKVESPLAFHRGIATVELDGVLQPGDEISLTDDGQTHNVRVLLGDKPAKEAPKEPAAKTHDGQASASQKR